VVIVVPNVGSGRVQHAELAVRVGDQAVYVVVDGAPDAPVLLLVHGFGASVAWWEPVVSQLAAAWRVVRVDLLGHGRSTSPVDGYDLPSQARRVGAVLDELGVVRVAVVVGHSTGGAVVTALAGQRPELVGALVLIGTGPSPEADLSYSPLSRLLFARVPGALLWRLFRGVLIRKSLVSAFSRPVEVPDALVAGSRSMTHRALAATAHASVGYIRECSMPERLVGLGKPLLVVFGAEDRRWRSSAAEDYRVVPGAQVVVLPGVGHTPMFEDTAALCVLLTDFAVSVRGL
jgi:pimeloyl-ACP methyl ester carboxylesterase